MDPTATLLLLLDALAANDDEEATHAARDLRRWLQRGGFRPEITDDQAQLLLDHVIASTV